MATKARLPIKHLQGRVASHQLGWLCLESAERLLEQPAELGPSRGQVSAQSVGTAFLRHHSASLYAASEASAIASREKLRKFAAWPMARSTLSSRPDQRRRLLR